MSHEIVFKNLVSDARTVCSSLIWTPRCTSFEQCTYSLRFVQSYTYFSSSLVYWFAYIYWIFFILFCNLFNDAVSNSATYDLMMANKKLKKPWMEGVVAWFKVLSLQLPRETEELHENPQSGYSRSRLFRLRYGMSELMEFYHFIYYYQIQLYVNLPYEDEYV
jgi:hypothetical protein